MEIASAGDAVVVAGKGHENYQLLGSRVIHFDDREVVREIAAELSAQAK
jgi:UDP-N-acetylmuramoyl-L-alanyl-D-glutamate--2,6-diaminopimelate ligase